MAGVWEIFVNFAVSFGFCVFFFVGGGRDFDKLTYIFDIQP